MKKHWRSIEEIENASAPEIPEAEFSVLLMAEDEVKSKSTTSRRDFLKRVGFGIGSAALVSGCEMPVRKAIPYLIKPDGIVPGVPNYYASTFFDGHEYCSILVKTREGRPIKIEGNELSKISKGGTSAKVQASVLSLYDDFRIKTPLKSKEKITWPEADAEITAALDDLSKKNEKIVILSSTVISPSTKKIFSDFIKKYPTAEIVTYDAISASAILEANKETFGVESLPSYRFENADLIVSFGADFLGTWLSPAEFTGQYSARRKITKENTNILKHIQYESTLSLSGSNADVRVPINPSEEGKYLLNLHDKIAEKAGKNNSAHNSPGFNIDATADELWVNKGRSLVISATNDKETQIVVNKINELLGNYGSTINLEVPSYLKQGIDQKMDELVSRMEKGEVKGIIIYNANPVYDYPESEKFIAGLSKTKLSVSLSETLDETAQLVTYICPDTHFLESWNDAEPKKGSYSFAQPVINKLFDTRQAQESLLKWSSAQVTETETKDKAGDNPYYLFIQKFWNDNFFNLQSGFTSFPFFWTNIIQRGVFESENTPAKPEPEVILSRPAFLFTENDFHNTATSILSRKHEGLECLLYESIAIGTGKHANNPWLQELPDPVSKVCWDNYAAISESFAKKYNLKNGDIVIVNELMELPVLIQPGQAENTVSIALGYGRSSAGKVADSLGKNAFKLIENKKNRSFSRSGLKLIPTGENFIFALTQTHHTMQGRDHVRHASLAEYKMNPHAGNEKHLFDQKNKGSLYKKREFSGHHWGIAIDLGLCTGCSACVISCQAENNVPVVGRDEVRNKRIMHWMRIDRYYSEQPSNPEVFFQPVMCQHCDSAPCENVCPVEATQNSKEGLNEMAYNRCIGTRYCMNNCPYRVRRFNWFEYSNNKKFDFNMNSDLGKMVLNPDVVVRSRGVVEKCSFCVQRIQEAKLKAKEENRELPDGEIMPACAQACPAKAIVFGDLSNNESMVSKAFADERNYFLLDEINTSPSVGYMTKIKRSDK